MVRLPRDRPGLVFLALLLLGALVLAGVLLAVFLTGGEETAPSTTASTASSATTETTVVPSTTAPPPTTQPATTAPPPTTAPPAPAGPLQTVSVGALSATVEWTGANSPARVAYGLPELGPTMWAPLVDRRATLSGLRFSTTYRVWAAEATLDVTTAPPPASPAAGIGNGAILLDGQPHFPLLVLAQCPSGYETTLAAGITLYAENACGGIADQTAGLAGRAFSLTEADEAGIGGPGVIGWYYPDEADLKEMTGATLPPFPPLSATARLRVLTLSNHFYSATAPLPAGRGVYPGLIEQADVVGFDLYPLQEFCDHAWLPSIAAAQRELVRLAPGKPTFQWIEASTWKCKARRHQVTPAVVRAESWLAVAGGARGLGYFPADWDPAVTPGIAAVAKEVAALGGGLLAADAPASASGPVIASARTFNGAQYVIAVNPTFGRVRATLSVPGLGGRSLTAVGEGRTLSATGDSYGDVFEPLGVHLYVAAPR